MRRYLSEMDDLLLDWDYIANEGVEIAKVTYGSITKYAWKCHVCGYEWKANMNTRCGKGTGCPCCSNKVVVAGKNDIATTDPWLLKEWNYDRNKGISPYMFTRGSGKKVWWKCKNCGYEWQAAIGKRVNGQGCPVEGGRAVLKGNNDFATQSPAAFEEWDYNKNTKKPYEVPAKSNSKAWWICKKCGHKWSAVISSRAKGAGCPVCAMNKRIEKANERAIADSNTLARGYSELAKEWNYEKNGSLMPEMVAPFSSKKVWWKCNRCGHEWNAIISNRVKGRGCPRCKLSNQTSLAEQILYQYVHRLFEDSIGNYVDDEISPYKLDIYIPHLSLGIEYDGEKWHQDVDKDERKTRLLSENGISLIRIREKGCPNIDDGSMQIKTKKPNYDDYEYLLDAILELNVLLSKISNESISTESLERLDYAEIKNAAMINYFDDLLKGSLASVCPEVAKEWDYEENGDLEPARILPQSNLKVGWKCNECGYKWKARICNRTRGTNCPRCAGKVLWPGQTDIKSNYPELMNEWDIAKNLDIKPEEIRAGDSTSKIWWICSKCGFEWQATAYNRARRHSGCPKCAIEYRREHYKNKNRKKVLCITTGEIFDSLTEAGRAHDVGKSEISKCCNGKLKTSGKISDGTRLRWKWA